MSSLVNNQRSTVESAVNAMATKSSSGYSLKPSCYKLLKVIGYGSSGIVYGAKYTCDDGDDDAAHSAASASAASSDAVVASMEKPQPQTPTYTKVALKVLNLDSFEREQLNQLRSELQIMQLCKHENLVEVLGSFVWGSKLCIVMPLFWCGSCLDIMKSSFPLGMDEQSISAILKQTLCGLDYLHRKSNLIHRDVKAGNLLMDQDGFVKLGDFGVSSCLIDGGYWQMSSSSSSAGATSSNLPSSSSSGTGGVYSSLKRNLQQLKSQPMASAYPTEHQPSPITTGNPDQHSGSHQTDAPQLQSQQSSSLHNSKPTILRKTFVGTPCWIAPEVVQQTGYDQRADIWSFGITALELANGRAPLAKYPPLKVLMMTVQNDPPTLEKKPSGSNSQISSSNNNNNNASAIGGMIGSGNAGTDSKNNGSANVHSTANKQTNVGYSNDLVPASKKFTKQFKDAVDACLQKDPLKRPSAEKLLSMSFFRNAKKRQWLVDKIVNRIQGVMDRETKSIPPGLAAAIGSSLEESESLLAKKNQGSGKLSENNRQAGNVAKSQSAIDVKPGDKSSAVPRAEGTESIRNRRPSATDTTANLKTESASYADKESNVVKYEADGGIKSEIPALSTKKTAANELIPGNDIDTNPNAEPNISTLDANRSLGTPVSSESVNEKNNNLTGHSWDFPDEKGEFKSDAVDSAAGATKEDASSGAKSAEQLSVKPQSRTSQNSTNPSTVKSTGQRQQQKKGRFVVDIKTSASGNHGTSGQQSSEFAASGSKKSNATSPSCVPSSANLSDIGNVNCGSGSTNEPVSRSHLSSQTPASAPVNANNPATSGFLSQTHQQAVSANTTLARKSGDKSGQAIDGQDSTRPMNNSSNMSAKQEVRKGRFSVRSGSESGNSMTLPPQQLSNHSKKYVAAPQCSAEGTNQQVNSLTTDQYSSNLLLNNSIPSQSMKSSISLNDINQQRANVKTGQTQKLAVTESSGGSATSANSGVSAIQSPSTLQASAPNAQPVTERQRRGRFQVTSSSPATSAPVSNNNTQPAEQPPASEYQHQQNQMAVQRGSISGASGEKTSVSRHGSLELTPAASQELWVAGNLAAENPSHIAETVYSSSSSPPPPHATSGGARSGSSTPSLKPGSPNLNAPASTEQSSTNQNNGAAHTSQPSAPSGSSAGTDSTLTSSTVGTTGKYPPLPNAALHSIPTLGKIAQQSAPGGGISGVGYSQPFYELAPADMVSTLIGQIDSQRLGLLELMTKLRQQRSHDEELSNVQMHFRKLQKEYEEIAKENKKLHEENRELKNRLATANSAASQANPSSAAASSASASNNDDTQPATAVPTVK